MPMLIAALPDDKGLSALNNREALRCWQSEVAFGWGSRGI